MTLKVECNECGTQVTVNSPGMNMWFQVAQVVMFPGLGEKPPVEGNFCTIACLIKFLQKREPKMEDLDGNNED